MKHTFRFFGRLENPGLAVIDDAEECLHLSKVLRLEVGALVEIVDGAGLLAAGKIQTISKKLIEVDVDTLQQASAKAQTFQLGIGALKPGDIDELLPSLIELGVDVIAVVQQGDTAKHRTNDAATQRWQRIARVSVKQCKSLFAPRIVAFESLESWLASLPQGTARVLFAEFAEQSIGKLEIGPQQPVVGFVGSERGINDQERATLAAANFLSYLINHQILRAYTAAIAGAAILSSRLEP